MPLLKALVLPLVGLIVGPVVALMAAGPPRDGPVLVIAAPWHNVDAIVARAGGQPVGLTAPLAGIAIGSAAGFPDRLRDAGALLVLDASTILALCGA
ncbi:MAG: hypothetical protein KDK24_17580 [Pseudooceanicola sp.]|nr:hypothetical protein [Pseudooceanicola sp.]